MDEDKTPPEDPEPTKTAADVPSEPLAAPPPTIGQYRILSKLGEGGMGVVYEAQQEHPKRKVAVKVVRGGQFVDEQRVRMFQREADTLARLKHANIAAIHESGRTEDGQHFFAMELVRGQTLDAYLKERLKSVTPQELKYRLGLFRKIADAVHYAHQRGVIHRDLKPSNVIVTDEAGGETGASTISGVRLPEIKILDFGLARITEGDVAAATMTTEVGVIKGTLPYMSPEQARGNPEDIDVRADVYALGVILYEILTGTRPYDVLRKSVTEALRVICEEPPKPLRQTWSGVRKLDPDVETIVGKALEKDANRRYGSAAALSEDIARYLTSQPILARPPSTTYQLRKFAKRHAVGVSFLVVSIVFLVALAATMTVQAARIAAERDRANREREASDRVSEFLGDMLGDVDPQMLGIALWEDLRDRVTEARKGRGATEEEVEITLAKLDDALLGVNATDAALNLLDEQVLARAAQTIEQQLGEDPRVAGRLERTLGETYRRLGLYARAELHAARAVEIRRQTLGAEHPATLQSMNNLAIVYDDQGRYDEAEELHGQVLEIRRRVLGAEHPDTLWSMDNLATAYRGQGRYDEAAALHRETLEMRRRVLGPEHLDTLSSVIGLANAYWFQGRYEEAADLYLETLEIRRRVLGTEHRDTLWSVYNLATTYWKLGRYGEAEKLFDETLEVRRRVLGVEHPDTLSSIVSLAVSHWKHGRYGEAEKLYREIFETRRRVLGPDHPDTADSLYYLAYVELVRGDREQAMHWLRQAVGAGYAKPDSVIENLGRLQGPEFDALVEQARQNAAAQGQD